MHRPAPDLRRMTTSPGDALDAISLREYRALAQLRFELRRFLAFSEDAARAAGIEPRQHQLMLCVKGLPEDEQPSIGAIAKRLLLQHHSTVELVRRSVEQGLVATSRSTEDGRVVLVTVTPHGEELLEQLTRSHREELRSRGPRLVSTLRDVVGEEIP